MITKDTPYRRDLYIKYMQTIQADTYNQERAIRLYEELLEDVGNYWIDIRHNGMVVGFFTICTFPCCHPDADYFLRDAYILPEYRKLGLMGAAVRKYINQNKGIYTLFVDKETPYTKEVWIRIFTSGKYKPFDLIPPLEFDDIITMQMLSFAPKKKKPYREMR